MSRRIAHGVALGATLMFVATLIFWLSIPPLDYSRFEQRSKVIEARDGTPLHVHLSKDDRYRLYTTPEDVSHKYLSALLATEDKYFFVHPGVNPFALARAGWQLLSSGRIVSGGSTITMQVARLFEPKSRSLRSKLIEMLRAIELEWRHSKQEILAMYLTMVPMGGNVEGIRAGAWRIWGADPKYLSLSQTASLLAIPQAPTTRKPVRSNQKFLSAREQIANYLIAEGLFPAGDKDELEMFDNFVLHPFPKNAWHMSQQLKDDKDVEQLTLDSRTQLELEALLKRFSEKLPPNLNAAAMVANAHTGEILAHVGSLGIHSKNGYVNFSRASRSPGSTLKPFVYGLAMDEQVINDQTVLFDVPTSFGGYRPENFNQALSGPIRAGDALQRSLNIPAVSVLNMIGTGKFMTAWSDAGLRLKLANPDQPILGIVLGSATTTLNDLMTAYTAIATEGGVIKLTNKTGETRPQSTFLVSSQTARTLRQILANVRSAQRQTSMEPLLPSATGFKTGTSVGFRDSWTLGFKGEYVIGVWVGTPTGSADLLNTGRNRALPVAEAIADLLPATSVIVPWTAEPIGVNDVPYQAPKIVYPDNGSELHTTNPPSPDRQLSVLLTGNVSGIEIYLNDKQVEITEHMQLPIPYDGFYDLELREGTVTIHNASFSILSHSSD